MPTQKELLERVLANQDEAKIEILYLKKQHLETSKKLAQTAMDFSTYITKQELHNAKINGYLENDSSTGTKGLVQQLAELTTKVASFDKKITIFTTSLIVLWTVIKFLISKLGILKLLT